ncbi:MAG: methyltransferase domain-containing protein [Planctomycetota bacterium]|nr:methyltransferase domain-containing protein [Planctomycetota bacterium]
MSDVPSASNGDREPVQDAHARVRDVFDDWADRGRAEGMESGHGFAARQGFDRLELTTGAHYLDVGCGNGYTVRWASDVVGAEGRAVGIDLSPNMIERARELSAGLPNVQFHEAAFPEHPLPRGAFAGIFSMEVLYYLPDTAGALHEIARLLQPGGRFACVVDYYRENEESHTWPDDLGVAMNLLSMAAWRGAFEEAGLTVIEQTCLQYPLEEGKEPGWKQTQGSLLTVGEKRA